MDRSIKSNETLYRRVRNHPNLLKDGNPTSALYKDSNGVSVSCQNDRSLNEVTEEELRLHNYYVSKKEIPNSELAKWELKAIVNLSICDCDRIGVCVKPDSNEDNIHHALILENENEIMIKQSKAKKLANASKIIKTY